MTVMHMDASWLKVPSFFGMSSGRIFFAFFLTLQTDNHIGLVCLFWKGVMEKEMKSVTKWMACMLVLTIMVTGFPTRVYAKSLGEADLSESSRGYCGWGNQDKDREEDSITVRVSIGGGDSDWETGDFSDYYVYKSGEKVFDQYELSFGDIDDDGDIDMTDLFNRLEDYKAGNTCDLSYSTSDYGDFYQDVFGISTGGSLTYKLNNIFCQAGTPDLYDGDSIVILLMTGDSNQWSEIDDSIYEHVTPSSNPNSVSTSWYDGDNGGTNDESGREGYYKYIDLMCENLEGSFTDNVSLSDGNCFWQEMRILRNNNITDPFYIDKLDYFEKYHEAKVAEAEAGKLKAVNAMRDASVTGNEQMLNYLAHGYNGTDAATFDIKAGQYAVDYILMCLDNEDYASNEEMAVKLTDAAESQSVRDDLIRYIVETDGCWGGSWFTYDTGAQNAQAIIPYYDMYPEVRERVDSFLAAAIKKFREDKNSPSGFDASSSSEVSRAFALMYCKTGKQEYLENAIELYNMVENIGLENTKFKGNAMDVWRMALNEWGLNQAEYGLGVDVIKNGFEVFYETATIGSRMTAHIRSNVEIEDMELYEIVVRVPESLSLLDVTSPIAENVEYHMDGNMLRIVLANLGKTLKITKASDVVAMNFKTTSGGLQKCTIESSIGYYDSESKKAIFISNEPVEVVEPNMVHAKILYRGTVGSRFIDKDSKVEKIIFGGKIETEDAVVVTVDGKTYDLYEATDMSSETTTVFLAYLPNTITEEQLMNIDNYEVVKGNEKKTIMIGDVDANSQVDVKDALHVIRLWVGKETIDSSRMLMSANVDGDSDITNSDTLAIVEYKVNSKQFKVLY